MLKLLNVSRVFAITLLTTLTILATASLDLVRGEEARSDGSSERYEEISHRGVEEKLRRARESLQASRIEAALGLATSAAEEARALKSPALEAEALALQGRVFEIEGNLIASLVALDDARRLYQQVGDEKGVARTLGSLGIVRQQSGDLAGAIALYEDSLAIYRGKTVRDEGNLGRMLRNLGSALVASGRLRKAEGPLVEAGAIFEEAGWPREEGSVVMEMGNLFFTRGEVARARESYEKAITLFQAAGESRGKAMATTNLAEVLAAEGKIEPARKAHGDAEALYRQTRDARGLCYADFRKAEILSLEGDSPGAIVLYEQAVEKAEEFGDEALRAEIRLGHARALRLQGSFDAAVAMARDAEQDLDRHGFEGLAALARVEIGLGLLAQERVAEAEAVYAASRERSADSESLRVRLAIRLLGARIGGSSADRESLRELVPELREVAAVANDAGLLSFEYEARLLLGAVGLVLGQDSSREALQELRREASEKGLGQVVRRVEDALETRPEA